MPTNYDRLFNQAQGDALINVLGGIKSSLDGNYPLEDLSVTLTNEAQTLYPNNNYGFNSVSVPAVVLEDIDVAVTNVPQLIYPNSGYVGINSVNVPAINMGTLEVTANGNYNAVTLGYDGFSDVEVNVPGGGGGAVPITTSNSLMYSFNSPVDIQTNNCYNLFYSFWSFNQPVNIPNNVQNCMNMFWGCRNFNQPVSIPEPTSTIMLTSMFQGCSNFNQPVNIPNNAYCNTIFATCTNFNQPVNIPETTKNIYGMFQACYNFNQPITIPETINQCGMLLASCNHFNQPMSFHNNITHLTSTFQSCTNFNYPITIPENCIDTSQLFFFCYNFNSPVKFMGNNVVSGVQMFFNCNTYNQPTVVRYDYTSRLGYGSWYNMFSGCTNLNSPIYLFPQNIKNARNMFTFCNNLSEVYIAGMKNNQQLFYAFRYNNQHRLNIFCDENSANYLKVTTLLANGAAVTASTWTDDVDNGCYYNTAWNIYVYNNWDGVVPE